MEEKKKNVNLFYRRARYCMGRYCRLIVCLSVCLSVCLVRPVMSRAAAGTRVPVGYPGNKLPG